jgi:hypothetical protein
MNKRTSQSAFFNLRVLIALLVTLTGVSLALLAFGTFAVPAASTTQAQQSYTTINSVDALIPPGFDCSKIPELGIDKQENMRAGLIMIACGLAQGGSASAGGSPGSGIFFGLIHNLLLAPSFIGGPDFDVILPDGTYPKVTQSESMAWGGPNNTWVVNYVDSRTSNCYSGLSYSTDNGSTWTAGQPFCSGHGTNLGGPIVVYNAHLGMWFAGDLATGCGGEAIGLWTSPDGVTWTAGACAHNGSLDDRESMWVDNNPASLFYGRMYVSFNNFAVGGGALQVVYSDNGTAWTGPVTLNGSLIRDIQITGDLQGSGRVYVAAMNEGGGGLTTRQNVMYRSTDAASPGPAATPGRPSKGRGDRPARRAPISPACSATQSPNGGTWVRASRRLAATSSALTTPPAART